MNIRLVVCLFIACLTVSVQAGRIAKVGADVVSSIISKKITTIGKVTDLLASPKDLLSYGYEKLVGLPVSLDALCKISLSGGSAMAKFTPPIDKLGLLFMKGTINVMYPLNQPEILLKDPNFKHDLPMVIYCTGFLTNLQQSDKLSVAATESIMVLFNAYAMRGGYNFVVLDTRGFIRNVHSWASLNTDAIGRLLAESLVKIVKVIKLKNIQLMGHSLGAHIVGSAGRFFHQTTGQFIPRITGLDPANPCFGEGEILSRGDADFVDIIHTNNGVFGLKEANGDVDFYPNGMIANQPGCLGTVCSHNRAWELYAETIYPGNENNFIATRCNSMKALNANMCNSRRIPMGFACPTNATGHYFLTTRKYSPFGYHFGGF